MRRLKLQILKRGMSSSVDKFKSTSNDRCELGKDTDGRAGLL